MRERIQAAYERRKQNAAAEKAAESNRVAEENTSVIQPAPAEVDVVRQQLDAELARGTNTTPQSTVAEGVAATNTENLSQSAVPENGTETEEHSNSLEARVKSLQEAYRNGSYETPEFNQQFPEFVAALTAAGGEKKVAMGMLLTQYYKLNEQLVAQRRQERLEKVSNISRRFETEFKITPEQLATIEGIEKLSEAQQKLLFENFTQLTLGNVREEAAALTANLTVEQRAAAVNSYGKVLGNAFAGIREAFTKSKNALANEKAVTKQLREGGFAVHQELLTELVRGMAESGPRVTEEKGELVIDFVNLSPEERGPEDGDVARSAALLSQEANAFARIPAAYRATLGVDDVGEKAGFGARFGRWLSTDKEQRASQELGQNAATAYESAKLGLTQALREKGMSDIQIAQRLLEADMRVSQQQMVMTDPDAIEALSEIENKSFWKETAKSFAKGNGLYLSLGFVGRTALGATGGILAAPLVAAGVASLRSWDSSAAMLRERDRNQRAGVKDTEAGALNVVTADSLIQKTELLLQRINNSATTPEDKQKLLNSLRVRTEYIRDKALLGRVSYGAKAEAVRAQNELAKKFGEATSVLAAEELNFRAAMADQYERLTGKLDSQQSRTKDRIVEERSQYRATQLTKSAVTASMFAGAGTMLAALAEEAKGGEKLGEYLKGIKSTVSTWWGETSIGKMTNGLDELRRLEEGGGSLSNAIGVPPEVTPAVPEKPVSDYTIERGDTLTKILKEQVIGGEAKPTPAQLARFFDSLNAAELRSIGVRSEEADLIFAGEKIDTEALKALWEAKAEAVTTTGSAALTATDEAYTNKLNQEAEIRTTVEPIIPSEEVLTPSEQLDAVNQLIPEATNGEEVGRVAQESVAANLETKVRAQAIHKQLLSASGVGDLEWAALRSMKMIDVMKAAAQNDSKDWFETLFGSPRDGWSPLGAGTNFDIKKLQEMVKLASSESIAVKASPGESVENFMRRLTTRLAEESKLGPLPSDGKSAL